MSASTRQRVNQYVADICRLTSQLGAVSKRDPAETRSAAVEKARAIYEELLTRKNTFQIPRGRDTHGRGDAGAHQSPAQVP